MQSMPISLILFYNMACLQFHKVIKPMINRLITSDTEGDTEGLDSSAHWRHFDFLMGRGDIKLIRSLRDVVGARYRMKFLTKKVGII